MTEKQEIINVQSKGITTTPSASCGVSIQRERQRVISEFGRFEDVMRIFNPSSSMCQTIADAYGSTAPTLTYLDICYGEGSAVMWLVMWISSVFASCGFINGKVTDKMKVDAANVIKQEFYFLNLNELEVFFKKFIAGKYEMFYGNPNPQVITKSLCSFVEKRKFVVQDVEARKEEERRKREMSSGNPIPFEEWARMMREKGEKIHLEVSRTGDGVPVYKPRPDEKLVSAESIVKNKSGCGKKTLAMLREIFISKYGEDPYDYYERKKTKQ